MHKQKSKQNSAVHSSKAAKVGKAKKSFSSIKKQPKRKIATTSRHHTTASTSHTPNIVATHALTSPSIAVGSFATQRALLHTTPPRHTPHSHFHSSSHSLTSQLPSLQQQQRLTKTQHSRDAGFKSTLRLLSQAAPATTKPVDVKDSATDASTTASTNPENDPAQPAKKESKFQQMYKKYGKLTVYTYLGVYVSTLAALAVGVNFIPGFDAQVPIQLVKDGHHFDRQFEFLEKTLAEFPRLQEFLNTYPKQTANFGAAWCLTKLTEPIRLVATGLLVPYIHRKRTGNTATEDSPKIEQDKQSV